MSCDFAKCSNLCLYSVNHVTNHRIFATNLKIYIGSVYQITFSATYYITNLNSIRNTFKLQSLHLIPPNEQKQHTLKIFTEMISNKNAFNEKESKTLQSIFKQNGSLH